MFTCLWFAATVCATTLLRTGPVQSSSGVSSSLFTNELRSGYSRLFQDGAEQPVPAPYVLLQRNPATEFLQANNNPLLLQQQRSSAPFSGPLSPTFQSPRPRYEYRRLSWSIPYVFVPTRFKPSWGGKSKPNDVLVVVIKTNSTCSANGTRAADDGDDGDDEDDDEGPNPDDDVEEVTVVVGGAEKGKEPSRCVWAILACCAPANTPIRFTCFDMLGCSTAFWDTNPCVPAIVRTALDQATKYYGPATNRTASTTPAPPADGTSTTPVATTIADASTAASAPAA